MPKKSNKKSVNFFLICLIAITLTAAALSFFKSCTKSVTTVTLKVTKVIDGDTVILSNGEKLRYIGIDTPEVNLRKKGEFIYQPQPFALEAKEFNRKLVENKRVQIEYDIIKRDKYDRLLGYLFINDTFVNAKMVEEGFAVIYTFPPNVKYTDLLISSQQKAKQNKKGLWGAYETIDASQAQKFYNQIRSVKGKVIYSRQSKKVTLLILGQGDAKHLTIAIFANSLDQFTNKNINPLTFYRGKIVEVSGKIRKYKGKPEIIVSTPEEIRIYE